MTGEFHAGPLRVSLSEMDCAPLRTVQIVAERVGWHWASRLWQEWHSRLPDIGFDPRHAQSDEVRRWLDSTRQEVTP